MDVNNKMQIISVDTVINDITPKLNATEKLEEDNKWQTEFRFKLNMNLEHVLTRYSKKREVVMKDPLQEVMLTPHAHEAATIEKAQQLYRRVQALQTQGVT